MPSNSGPYVFESGIASKIEPLQGIKQEGAFFKKLTCKYLAKNDIMRGWIFPEMIISFFETGKEHDEAYGIIKRQ
jgi:hypothetical protein